MWSSNAIGFFLVSMWNFFSAPTSTSEGEGGGAKKLLLLDLLFFTSSLEHSALIQTDVDGDALFWQVEFSEMLLPFLVHEILSCGYAEHRELLSQRVSGFFRTHCELAASNTARIAAGKLLFSFFQWGGFCAEGELLVLS